MANIYWTRMKLWQWGRAVRESGIGYPSMSSHEKIRSGAGVMVLESSLPDDLLAIDMAVRQAPPQHKLLLTEHYTKTGSAREHAARVGLSKDVYFSRKAIAEDFIAKRT